jgi:hypothetical protein
MLANWRVRAFLKKKPGASCGRGCTLLGVAPIVRGLPPFQTLARRVMAIANVKRLGRRWAATAFPPRRIFSTFFSEQNRYMIYGDALVAWAMWGCPDH